MSPSFLVGDSKLEITVTGFSASLTARVAKCGLAGKFALVRCGQK
jgi:hypothetical protein